MSVPKLLMDRSKILESYKQITSALPQFNIAYAMKANSHTEIITLLNQAGSHFETASIEEIRNLIAMGITSDRIIFSNPVKPVQAIMAAIELGIYYMSFDSVDEVIKFSPFRKNMGAMLRVDVSNEGSLWVLNGKFGCPESLWEEIFSKMQEENIPLAGITFHVGSQCESINTWNKAMDQALKAIQMSHKFNLTPHTLNIGGGFPINLGRKIPDIKEIGETIQKNIEKWKSLGVHIKKFYAEPGRFIAGPAGTMMSHVIGIAKREIKGKIEKWVFLDTGVFSGFMETIDGITYPMLSNGSGDIEEVMLCGPSCDSADKMYKAKLPSPRTGDTIYFSGAGAYTTAYASEFNGIQPPKVQFLDSFDDIKKATLID